MESLIIKNPNSLPEFKKDLNVSYIYFLWFDNTIVYIGETVNLESRINAHYADKLFDKITYETLNNVDTYERRFIERVNIKQYKPIFNDNANALLKTNEFCFYRNGGKGKRYNTGECVIEEHNRKYSHYDGNQLHSIERFNVYIYRKLDLDIVETITPQRGEQYEFKFINNKLEIIKTYILDSYEPYSIKKTPKQRFKNTPKVRTLELDSKLFYGKYRGYKYIDVITHDFKYAQWFTTVFQGAISSEVTARLFGETPSDII